MDSQNSIKRYSNGKSPCMVFIKTKPNDIDFTVLRQKNASNPKNLSKILDNCHKGQDQSYGHFRKIITKIYTNKMTVITKISFQVIFLGPNFLRGGGGGRVSRGFMSRSFFVLILDFTGFVDFRFPTD